MQLCRKSVGLPGNGRILLTQERFGMSVVASAMGARGASACGQIRRAGGNKTHTLRRRFAARRSFEARQAWLFLTRARTE